MVSLKDLQLTEQEPLPMVSLPAVSSIPVKREPFLCGPIPLAWLSKAAKVRGSSTVLASAIVIWFLVGVDKSNTVHLRPSLLRDFGVERTAGYRALKAMTAAGLIRVDHRRGRAAVVTIIES